MKQPSGRGGRHGGLGLLICLSRSGPPTHGRLIEERSGEYETNFDRLVQRLAFYAIVISLVAIALIWLVER
jgi:hypothetical protein